MLMWAFDFVVTTMLLSVIFKVNDHLMKNEKDNLWNEYMYRKRKIYIIFWDKF